MEYLSESSYPWLSENGLAIQEDYFLQDVISISDLPAGIADISPIDVGTHTSILSDDEIESIIQALQKRIVL